MKINEPLLTKHSEGKSSGGVVTTALPVPTPWLTLLKSDHKKNSLCLEGPSEFANCLRVWNVSWVTKKS